MADCVDPAFSTPVKNREPELEESTTLNLEEINALSTTQTPVKGQVDYEVESQVITEKSQKLDIFEPRNLMEILANPKGYAGDAKVEYVYTKTTHYETDKADDLKNNSSVTMDTNSAINYDNFSVTTPTPISNTVAIETYKSSSIVTQVEEPKEAIIDNNTYTAKSETAFANISETYVPVDGNIYTYTTSYQAISPKDYPTTYNATSELANYSTYNFTSPVEQPKSTTASYFPETSSSNLYGGNLYTTEATKTSYVYPEVKSYDVTTSSTTQDLYKTEDLGKYTSAYTTSNNDPYATTTSDYTSYYKVYTTDYALGASPETEKRSAALNSYTSPEPTVKKTEDYYQPTYTSSTQLYSYEPTTKKTEDLYQPTYTSSTQLYSYEPTTKKTEDLYQPTYTSTTQLYNYSPNVDYQYDVKSSQVVQKVKDSYVYETPKKNVSFYTVDPKVEEILSSISKQRTELEKSSYVPATNTQAITDSTFIRKSENVTKTLEHMDAMIAEIKERHAKMNKLYLEKCGVPAKKYESNIERDEGKVFEVTRREIVKEQTKKEEKKMARVPQAPKKQLSPEEQAKRIEFLIVRIVTALMVILLLGVLAGHLFCDNFLMD